VKGEEGRCVTAEEREAQQEAKKAKKKKKKKKKKKEVEAGKKEEEPADKRRIYPWYYMVAPLTISYLLCRFWRPNIVTSMGIILFVSASATLG
jgi:hypothetical protein